jgi:hypothetical protein
MAAEKTGASNNLFEWNYEIPQEISNKPLFEADGKTHFFSAKLQ